ncbi:MAG: Uma2 family endonuclease [Pseudanabaena sp. CAN_BIN31]|nr:Uma2 family endonuclease [Pseudanabaena sp. CAN_BIN31]
MTITPIAPKPEIATVANRNAVLTNISWQTYQALLADISDHRATLLTYDRGTLEIKMPLELHEAINRILERIIVALTEELGLDIKSFGSTIFNRQDLQIGIEPDSCFYIQNAHLIRRFQIDLEIDPPPDLVVEVDIHSSSTRRLPIYQKLGVPELWQYSRMGIKIYHLQVDKDKYTEQQYSSTFPMISGEVLEDLLAKSETMGENQLIREFKQWIQQQ